MALFANRRCAECGGTGECPKCFGTGENTALNSDKERCPVCHGTGQCQACRDKGGIIGLDLAD